MELAVFAFDHEVNFYFYRSVELEIRTRPVYSDRSGFFNECRIKSSGRDSLFYRQNLIAKQSVHDKIRFDESENVVDLGLCLPPFRMRSKETIGGGTFPGGCRGDAAKDDQAGDS